METGACTRSERRTWPADLEARSDATVTEKVWAGNLRLYQRPEYFSWLLSIFLGYEAMSHLIIHISFSGPSLWRGPLIMAWPIIHGHGKNGMVKTLEKDGRVEGMPKIWMLHQSEVVV